MKYIAFWAFSETYSNGMTAEIFASLPFMRATTRAEAEAEAIEATRLESKEKDFRLAVMSRADVPAGLNSMQLAKRLLESPDAFKEALIHTAEG